MFGQFETHERLNSVSLPIRKPREDQQARRFNLPVLAHDGERPATDAITTHHPLSARVQIRLHVRRLKSSFGSPPFDSLGRIGQCLEDAFCWRPDHNFLDDGVV
jgi:hypothetical protein